MSNTFPSTRQILQAGQRFLQKSPQELKQWIAENPDKLKYLQQYDDNN